jgi:glycosyltransferase involved in cell wall biosynthesis
LHNEASILEQNIEAILNYLKPFFIDYEILLIENGSLDSTSSIAIKISHKYGRIRVLIIDEACLGEALKRGIKESSFQKVIYFPIDLSIPFDFIKDSIALLDEWDIVIGSKHLNSDSDRRRIHRRIFSRYFHWLVKRLCRTKISDTTCVKAYNKEKITEVIDKIPSISQIFETELILEAQRRGFRITEIPVVVTDNRTSRQAIIKKVQYKLRDLMTFELSYIAFLVGLPVLLFGLIIMIFLIYEKIKTGLTGFPSPYSFLISVLMVFTGIQILFFGLLANMMVQIRRNTVR